MAKFFGNVGYAVYETTKPGITKEKIIERPYYGDVGRNLRRLRASENLHDDIELSNEVSIISDDFAEENIFNIRYVVWKGVKWKVTNAEVLRPRIILSLGGVYNA